MGIVKNDLRSLGMLAAIDLLCRADTTGTAT